MICCQSIPTLSASPNFRCSCGWETTWPGRCWIISSAGENNSSNFHSRAMCMWCHFLEPRSISQLLWPGWWLLPDHLGTWPSIHRYAYNLTWLGLFHNEVSVQLRYLCICFFMVICFMLMCMNKCYKTKLQKYLTWSPKTALLKWQYFLCKNLEVVPVLK